MYLFFHFEETLRIHTIIEHIAIGVMCHLSNYDSFEDIASGEFDLQ